MDAAAMGLSMTGCVRMVAGVNGRGAATSCGRPQDNGKHVECRVTETALTRRCGANGIANAELHRAFKEHRARIEAIAKSKYAAEKVRTKPDRTVIVLGVADL